MKWSSLCAALLLLGGSFAAEAAVELTKKGTLSVDGCEFAVTLYDKGWGGRESTRKEFQLVRDDRKNGVGEVDLRFSGLPLIPNGTLNTSLKGTADAMQYTADLRFENPADLNSIALVMTFPRGIFTERRIVVDGKEVTLPPPGKKTASFKFRCSEIMVPTGEGELRFNGDINLLLQEFRLRPGVWQMRLLFTPSSGDAVSRASLKVGVRSIRYPSAPLDLRSAANMGFADDVAGDGKGGWTDQGAENDLSMLPVGRHRLGGIDFEIIDPAKNNGLSCIMLAGPNSGRPFRSEAATGTLDSSAAGEYLYVLHAGAYDQKPQVGEIILTYADGATQTIPVRGFVDVGNWWKPIGGDNSTIVWVGENRSSYLGLYRSSWKIEKKPIRKIAFRATDSTVWGVIALSVGDHPVLPAGEVPAYIVSGKEWKPFEYRRDVEPGSVMDFSSRLDAPAGKYGPVVIRNGHFEFRDRPGEPVRFYGTNVCGGVAMLDHEWADRLADRIAAEGYNAVRFHHQDSSYTSPESLERFDYFIAALKKRGIYMTTDLYVTFRPPATEIPEVGERPPKAIIDAREYKGLFYVMDPVFEHYRKRVSTWLNHVNPYTGIAIKDEPAIVTLNYFNEANINSFWNNTEFTTSLYNAAFEKYCKERGISPAPGPERELHFNEFLTSLYLKRYHQMKEFIAKLGVEKPFSDQNMAASPRLQAIRNLYDFVDNHSYFAHPTFIGPNKTMPLRFSTDSALKGQLRSPGVLFATRLYGRPFTISEFDFPRPNPFRAEGAPIVSAYAALQGYDALYHFAYAHSPVRVREDRPSVGAASDPFDATSDPVKALSQRIGSGLFLNGGVKASTLSFAILQNGIDGTLYNQSYPVGLCDLGLIGAIGTAITPDYRSAAEKLPKETAALLDTGYNFPADHGSLPVFDAQQEDLLLQMQKRGILKPEWYDAERGIFRSSTGQIELDRKQMSFRVTAPGGEVLILSPGHKGSGNFMAVENKVGRGVFAALPHTGRTLADAKRILLLHLTDSQATKTKFRSEEMNQLESFGVMPYLVARGEAELTLPRSSGEFRCYAVDSAGKRLAELPATVGKDGSSRFSLRTFRPEGTVIAYELVRK